MDQVIGNSIPIGRHVQTRSQSLRILWDSLVSHLARYRQRALTRRALSEMEPRLLQDIGISRAEALREAEKPFWVE